MRPPDNEFGRAIKAEIERERRVSRYRDRVSGKRVHPIQHDLNCLINFVIARRQRQPEALDTVRRVLLRVDTAALRTLIDIIRHGGRCDITTRCRCDRYERYCDAIEAALSLIFGESIPEELIHNPFERTTQ